MFMNIMLEPVEVITMKYDYYKKENIIMKKIKEFAKNHPKTFGVLIGLAVGVILGGGAVLTIGIIV